MDSGDPAVTHRMLRSIVVLTVPLHIVSERITADQVTQKNVLNETYLEYTKKIKVKLINYKKITIFHSRMCLYLNLIKTYSN